MDDQENPWAAPDAAGGSSHLGAAGEDDLWIPATAGQRFVAYMVDSLLAGGVILGALLVVMMVPILLDPEAFDVWLEAYGTTFDLFGRVAGFAATLAYGSLFEGSSWNATPGKRLMGIEVVDLFNQPLDYGEALKRNFAKTMMLSCCGLLAVTVFSGDGLWNETTSHRVMRRVG